MYYLVDILAIIFILFFTIYGFCCGFYKSTIDFILVFVCFGVAILCSYFTTVYFFSKIGWLEELSNFVLGILGNTKISGLQQTIEKVAYSIAVGILMLVCFIVYNIILHFIRRLFLKGIDKIRKKAKALKIIGNILGGFGNFIVSSVIVLLIMAIPHAFKESDLMFRRSNEVLQASEVLSLVYDINPLNDVISSLGIQNIETNLKEYIK